MHTERERSGRGNSHTRLTCVELKSLNAPIRWCRGRIGGPKGLKSVIRKHHPRCDNSPCFFYHTHTTTSCFLYHTHTITSCFFFYHFPRAHAHTHVLLVLSDVRWTRQQRTQWAQQQHSAAAGSPSRNGRWGPDLLQAVSSASTAS